MKTIVTSRYKLRTYLRTALLLAAMAILLSITGWLVAGTAGVAWILFFGAAIMMSTAGITPRIILRWFGAQALYPEDAPRLYETVAWLVERAGMKKLPVIYYMPGAAINAFSTGFKGDAAVAISDGMLRALNDRELTGVLAHEVSHIHSNDILVMLVADMISRMTSVMAFAGYVLIWIYIPLFILTGALVPWALLLVLVLAPTVSTLIQLALSRSREFSADMEAATLTGDPLGLASALEKIERQHESWVSRMFLPRWRNREPSLLCTHPLLADRVDRLKALALQMRAAGNSDSSGERVSRGRLRQSKQIPQTRFLNLRH